MFLGQNLGGLAVSQGKILLVYVKQQGNFGRKFVDIMKKEPFGFTVSPADPFYVDDMLNIGKNEQIQEFATKIQKEFSEKIQHNLADYLGCEFHMNKEKTRG